jgi:hypothetical protein
MDVRGVVGGIAVAAAAAAAVCCTTEKASLGEV